MLLFVFALAAGFVTAGLLNALHLVIQEAEGVEEGAMVLYFDSPSAIAWSLVICVFAGPYVVLSRGYQFWRQDVLPPAALGFCMVISLVWSFCSGVVLFEAAAAIGILAS